MYVCCLSRDWPSLSKASLFLNPASLKIDLDMQLVAAFLGRRSLNIDVDMQLVTAFCAVYLFRCGASAKNCESLLRICLGMWKDAFTRISSQCDGSCKCAQCSLKAEGLSTVTIKVLTWPKRRRSACAHKCWVQPWDTILRSRKIRVLSLGRRILCSARCGFSLYAVRNISILTSDTIKVCDSIK